MINSIGSAFISTLQPGSLAASKSKVQAPQEEKLYCQAAVSDQVDIRPQTQLEKVLAATSAKAAQLEQDLEPHVPGQVIVKTKGSLMQSTGNVAKNTAPPFWKNSVTKLVFSRVCRARCSIFSCLKA